MRVLVLVYIRIICVLFTYAYVRKHSNCFLENNIIYLHVFLKSNYINIIAQGKDTNKQQ